MKLESLCIISGNVKWYTHHGKQYSSFSKRKAWNYDLGIPFLAYTPPKIWKQGKESRWQNRKMWNSLLLTSTSRIHLQMKKFSQGSCWTPVEDLRHRKGPQKSSCHLVGWKKEEAKWEGTTLFLRAEGAGCWNGGFGEQTNGGDGCWILRDSLKGWE